MTRIAYYRVSSTDQSIDAQRHAMGGDFDLEFSDEGVSGAIPAAEREGFAAMLKTIKARKNKQTELHVYAVDRLGRDSIDVQTTVRDLTAAGVRVVVRGLGGIEGEAGKLLLALMAQFAEMERNRIRARADAGRDVARKHLAEHGVTHKGAASLGRPVEHDAKAIAEWRLANGASIRDTAKHFGTSDSTVKRACAAAEAP